MTTSGELEQLQRLEKIVIRAREGGHADLLAKAAVLLGQIVRAYHPNPDGDGVPPDRAPPHDGRAPARAHAREDTPLDDRQLDGLHKLRKGRDQCGATRRDGEPCQAPAVKGHYVCRRHGGAAPQVAINAEYQRNLVRVYGIQREYEEAKGTAREFDALCRALQAGRDLEAHQLKIRLLREFRAGLSQRNRAGKPMEGTDSAAPI